MIRTVSRGLGRYKTELVLAVTSAVFLWIGIQAYYDLRFTSDGFHYYSALRNFVQGHGPWEGPVFGYLPGFHAYLTLFLLAPLVAVFHSPLVLLVTGVLSHGVTAWLVCLLYRRLAGERYHRGIEMLLGILYLAMPLVFGQLYAEIYLFQPDFFMPPLFLTLALSLQRKQQWLFALATALLAATKEEYIPLCPVITFYLVLLLQPFRGYGRKKTFGFFLWPALVYAGVSAVALGIMFHYKAMNEIPVVTYLFSPEVFGDPAMIRRMIRIFVQCLYPLIPVLTVLLVFSSMRIRWMMALCVLIFVAGRLLVSMLFYEQPEFLHWSNLIMMPALFTVIAAGFAWMPVSDRNRIRRLSIAGGLALSLAMALFIDVSHKLGPAGEVAAHLEEPDYPLQIKSDIYSVARSLPEPGDEPEYIICEENFMGPFMARSHATLGWTVMQPPERKKELIRNANFIILPRYMIKGELRDYFGEQARLYAETLNLIVYEKR